MNTDHKMNEAKKDFGTSAEIILNNYKNLLSDYEEIKDSPIISDNLKEDYRKEIERQKVTCKIITSENTRPILIEIFGEFRTNEFIKLIN